MTAGELFEVFKQNDIPDNAVLMSNSGWEGDATNMDGIYYNKIENTVVFTQEFNKYDDYYKSPDWIKCKKKGN